MDQEKYKSSAKSLDKNIPLEMPLYNEIEQGNVDFLLKAFLSRREKLQLQIRQGGTQEDFARWQACVDALDAACIFLNQHKSL